ncbi:MAG: LacI family transcriptional regulator [Actinomycetota bacterium]|nr:LacI family transcriptional regulator [Actinomycetota bacterium]
MVNGGSGPPGERRSRPAGIKAVAARAGVSVGTVSNVLNRPTQVSESTRARVLAAIDELGFVRHSSASQLRAGRSHTVGLVVLDIGNPFFTDLARGLEAEAAEHALSVLLFSSDGSAERQRRQLRFLEEQRVEGVLITPVGDEGSDLVRLQDRGTRVVMVDAVGAGRHCSVRVDDNLGGSLAGSHLIHAGRRRITYVTASYAVRQCRDRGTGLTAAIASSGARAPRQVEVPTLTGSAGYEATARVLAQRPDAVFCANDIVALGLLRGLLEAGARVPDDIALVGYDDIEFAATAAVPLSSVRQPAGQLGRTAAALLVGEFADGGSHVHEDVVFSPELVTRASSGGVMA